MQPCACTLVCAHACAHVTYISCAYPKHRASSVCAHTDTHAHAHHTCTRVHPHADVDLCPSALRKRGCRVHTRAREHTCTSCVRTARVPAHVPMCSSRVCVCVCLSSCVAGGGRSGQSPGGAVNKPRRLCKGHTVLFTVLGRCEALPVNFKLGQMETGEVSWAWQPGAARLSVTCPLRPGDTSPSLAE